MPRRRGALDCPPAVVTKHVQSLERRLGTRLLNRDTRHVVLTEAGALYWEHCRHVLAQPGHAEPEVGALGRLPRGLLRVSAPYDFGAAEVESAVLDASATAQTGTSGSTGRGTVPTLRHPLDRRMRRVAGPRPPGRWGGCEANLCIGQAMGLGRRVRPGEGEDFRWRRQG